MTNYSTDDILQLLIRRAIRLNGFKKLEKDAVPEVILKDATELFDKAITMLRERIEQMAVYMRENQIQACKDSCPCFFCGNRVHPDDDYEPEKVTCKKGHSITAMEEDFNAMKTGCVDFDPKGAVFELGYIADEIKGLEESYSKEGIQEAIDTIGESIPAYAGERL